MKQGSDDWHKARSGKITCSKLYEAITHCPKYLAEVKGLAAPFKGNVATQWGTDHEPLARSAFEVASGELVTETGFVVHPRFQWFGGSPDGLFGTDGVLEIKCHYTRTIPDRPKVKHWAQVQGVLEVTDRIIGSLFYWTPSQQREFKIVRDRAWFESVWPRIEAFYGKVTDGLRA